MVTLKSLQKPKIIDVIGAKILIQHPDISTYPLTFLRAQFSSGATAVSFGDNDEFVDDDWMIIGGKGDAKTEEVDVNGAVTRGTALTITNTTKFDHESNDPVTKIYERKITIYGASTDGGSLTSIRATAAAIDIAWNRPHTEFTLLTTDTAYAYYVVKFYDGTTESAASDYILAAGDPYNSVSKLIMQGLDEARAVIGNELSWEYLTQCVDDCQSVITQATYSDRTGRTIKVNWPFELTGAEDSNTWLTLLRMENRYLLSDLTTDMKYSGSKDSIFTVQIGNLQPLEPFSINDYLLEMRNYNRTELSTASSAADTSITVKDASIYTATGTLQIGTDSPTYTARSLTTNIVSGIPASGTGSLAAGYLAGRAVWQGASGGLPKKFCIYNGDIYLDRPVSSTYASYKLKFRYYKKLDRITEVSDTTPVTFTNAFRYYIAYKIYLRRNDIATAKEYKTEFDKILVGNIKAETTPSLVSESYYDYEPSVLEQYNGNDFPYTSP